MRDVYDHTIQTIDTIESFRDILSGMQDLYLSIISNRMNEVMKVLTIIATIFIPITFVAGIYGMNFTHMPELTWRWGYLCVWLIILAMAHRHGGFLQEQEVVVRRVDVSCCNADSRLPADAYAVCVS